MLNPTPAERQNTTPEYRIEGVCRHLRGLRRHLEEIGRHAEAAAVQTALDLLAEAMCRRGQYVERVR